MMGSLLKRGKRGDAAKAFEIYKQGAHSKSYATVKLAQTTGKIAKGTAFVGTSLEGKPVRLTAYKDALAGSEEVKLQYDASFGEARCQVGSSTDPVLSGCLLALGTIQLDGIASTPLEYSYDPMKDNVNGRTLAGFSLGAESKMGKCQACPYVDYQKFLDYYDAFDYGDQWVTAAFEGKGTNFKLGNVDFETFSETARNEAAIVASAFLNVWMYVVREFEDALDDCAKGCATDQCNANKVNAWDEGVAFYVGSLEGSDGSGEGVLQYALADDLCQEFKTCGAKGIDTTGTSQVNHKVYEQFDIGLELLLREECEATRSHKNRLAELMIVPLVQAVLRSVYLDTPTEAEKGQGVAYAATLLPFVHGCNPSDANIIYRNMAYNGKRDFAAVKLALESSYKCIGITCQDVGGLWDNKLGQYYEGASPCTDDGGDSLSTFFIAVPVMVVIGLVVFVVAYRYAKRNTAATKAHVKNETYSKHLLKPAPFDSGKIHIVLEEEDCMEIRA